jgi:hypothetical protein
MMIMTQEDVVDRVESAAGAKSRSGELPQRGRPRRIFTSSLIERGIREQPEASEFE